MLAVISTVSLLSVSTGSIASSNLGQKSSDSTPAFLQNTGAVMMTDGQMASVRGEFYDNMVSKIFVKGIYSNIVNIPYYLWSTVTDNGRGMIRDLILKIDWIRGDHHGYNWLNSRGYWD